MSKFFSFPLGVELTDLTGIEEGYETNKLNNNHSSLKANVSDDKMKDVLSVLFSQIDTPMYLVLEVPATQMEEAELRTSDEDPYHVNVYFLDGLDKQGMKAIFNKYWYIFINDGISNFGFGSNIQNEEVFLGGYKVVHISSQMLEKFTSVLEKKKINQVSNLRTAWNNLSPKTPGRRERIESNGKDIYDVVQELKKAGLYLAKTVPEE